MLRQHSRYTLLFVSVLTVVALDARAADKPPTEHGVDRISVELQKPAAVAPPDAKQERAPIA